jgi:hypothetical protein
MRVFGERVDVRRVRAALPRVGGAGAVVAVVLVVAPALIVSPATRHARSAAGAVKAIARRQTRSGARGTRRERENVAETYSSVSTFGCAGGVAALHTVAKEADTRTSFSIAASGAACAPPGAARCASFLTPVGARGESCVESKLPLP